MKNKKLSVKKILLISAVVLAASVIAASAVLFIIFSCNEYTLALSLNGDEEIVLEYGEEYKEEGAEAEFFGSLVSRKPRDVEVRIRGEVDETMLGSYTLTYTAEYTRGDDAYTETLKRRVKIVDTTSPELELVYIEGAYTLPNQPYSEEGFTAADNYDGDITDRVVSYEEDGKVYYSITDSSGNTAEAVREIFYDDPIPPELTLAGASDTVISESQKYTEAGYSAADNVDGDITSNVSVESNVVEGRPGKYTITYTVSDGYDNTVSAKRQVTVTSDQPSFGSEEDVPRTEPEEPNGKVIYLTFDDGPGKHTERLLDILDKYEVKATFFVVDSQYLDLLPKMAESGHTIAMHTGSHNYDSIYASEEAYFNDLYGIQSAIKEKVGYSPTIFRFPGGSSNLVSSYNPGIMSRLTELTKANGYRYFDWNVDSNDAGGTRTAEGVYNNVIREIPKFEHSIVLQHDTNGYSVDAVEKIIEWGLENGYTFKPLTEYAPVCEHGVQN